MEEYSEIKHAKQELEDASQDERTRRLAELRDKALSDEKALLRTGYTKGKIEGIQEGKNAGMQEAKIETANKMLKENIDIEIILRVTGITKEELEKIKSSFD